MGDALSPLTQVPPPKNYCNVTFLSIGDVGPDGLPIEQLLRCSRCQDTYYCGKEQQRSHWKLHKFVCRPAREEAPEERFAGLSMGTVANNIMIVLHHLWDGVSTQTLRRNVNMGRPFLFLLKRLEVLSHEEPDNAITGTDVASAASMINWISALPAKSDRTIELLWAIPGMTTFLLNLELLSVAMRERKLAAAVPSDDELRHPQAIQPSRSFFIFTDTMCRFIESSFVAIKNAEDCVAHYRENAIASCAARKMMQLYGDPYTRGSFPLDKSETPRTRSFPGSFSLLLHRLPEDPLDSKVLIPGLTVHAVFQIIITEPEWQSDKDASRNMNAIKYLLQSASAKPEAWEVFSVEARALTAHKLLGLYCQLDSNNGKDVMADAEALTRLIFIVVGFNCITNAKNDAMWLKVIKHAATLNVGPFAGVFSQWYNGVALGAGRELAALARYANFSMDLIPSPVGNHILEYAMDPFCLASPLMGTIPLLLRNEGIPIPFIDEFFKQKIAMGTKESN